MLAEILPEQNQSSADRGKTQCPNVGGSLPSAGTAPRLPLQLEQN